MTLTLALRWLARHRVLLAFHLVALFVFAMGLVFIGAEFEGGAGLEPIVELLPAMIQKFVQHQVRDFSADSIVGFGFHHPVIVTAMCAVTALFATSPAADREEGLLGLLLARPVSRAQYLTAALLDVALLAVVQPLVVLAGGQLGLAFVELPTTLPWTAHLDTALGVMALLLSVAGLALLSAVVARRRGEAVARLAGLLVPLYLIEFLGFLWSGLDALRWLSPFHYVSQLPSPMLAMGGAESGSPLVLLVVFAVTTAAAALLFSRADV